MTSQTDRKIHWRCFHCGDAFTKAQEQHARAHFGADESALPICQMRLPGEYHLLNILRKQEDELHAFYAEDTELWRALHAQAADHAQALRREEERGFAKGVAEARGPLRAVMKVRPVNWDDDDDPEQVAAWKLVAEFVGEEPAEVDRDVARTSGAKLNAFIGDAIQKAAEGPADVG